MNVTEYANARLQQPEPIGRFGAGRFGALTARSTDEPSVQEQPAVRDT